MSRGEGVFRVNRVVTLKVVLSMQGLCDPAKFSVVYFYSFSLTNVEIQL